jgi:RNA polymerase primary sigma factor
MESKNKNSLIYHINRFIKFAAQKKIVSLDDFRKFLPSKVYYSKQFFRILEILEKKGVKIKEEYADENTSSSKVQYNNHYMKEMSRYSLLTEEEEIFIIKLLEENEVILMKEIVQTPHFFVHLFHLAKTKYRKKIKSGTKNTKLQLKKWVTTKIKSALEKETVMALKKEFKIPRSDILKISRKVILKTEDENKIRKMILAIQKIENLHEKLINSNLRLVLSIAKKYARRKNNNLFDLIQEGNLGLIKAVEMFYYHQGVRFAAYAKWWIKQSIIRSLYENNHHMKIPLHFIDAIKRLEEYISLYIQENKKYPTIDQMTKSTGFSPKKIRRILNIIAKPLSLDTPVFYKDSLVELKDTLKDQKHGEPSENVFQAMVSSNIRQLLAGLSERERKIIIKRYGLEDGIQHTLDEVGYYFNLTRERIRQIEHKALDKLKVPSKITLCKKLIEGE